MDGAAPFLASLEGPRPSPTTASETSSTIGRRERLGEPLLRRQNIRYSTAARKSRPAPLTSAGANYKSAWFAWPSA